MGNFNLDVTLKKVLEEFRNRGAQEMAWKAGAGFENNEFEFIFLHTPVIVSYPEGKVTIKDSGQEMGIIETILVLHYLVHAGGNPLVNRQISFKELPGGSIYIEPFTNRCIRPLIYHFGNNLEQFDRASNKCGGSKEKFGDISYCFQVLPNVSVTLVLWEGDDEFPANANILFDETAGDYLPTEDYAFLCGMLVNKLKKCKD